MKRDSCRQTVDLKPDQLEWVDDDDVNVKEMISGDVSPLVMFDSFWHIFINFYYFWHILTHFWPILAYFDIFSSLGSITNRSSSSRASKRNRRNWNWWFFVFSWFWASLMVQEASLMIPDAPYIDPKSTQDRSWIEPEYRFRRRKSAAVLPLITTVCLVFPPGDDRSWSETIWTTSQGWSSLSGKVAFASDTPRVGGYCLKNETKYEQ